MCIVILCFNPCLIVLILCFITDVMIVSVYKGYKSFNILPMRTFDLVALYRNSSDIINICSNVKELF